MFICHSWIISSSSALVPENRLNGRTTDVSIQHYHSSGCSVLSKRSADAHHPPRIAWMSGEDIHHWGRKWGRERGHIVSSIYQLFLIKRTTSSSMLSNKTYIYHQRMLVSFKWECGIHIKSTITSRSHQRAEVMNFNYLIILDDR